MGQFSNVLLAINKEHTVAQMTLDCRPGLGELKQVMGPTIPLTLFTVYVANILTSLPPVQIGFSIIS